MGIEHVTWALRRVRGVSPAEKMVLIGLALSANKAGVCSPRIADIQDDTGLSRATVKRSIERLADIGLLSKFERVGGGRQLSNLFEIKKELARPQASLVGGRR